MFRVIEEYSLNAWPALHTQNQDGWLLRFAEGYTKRANSINPIYNDSNENLLMKIRKSEELYAKAGVNTVFKITPFAPTHLDMTLEELGYEILEPSSVQILDDLENIREPHDHEIAIEEVVTPKWLDLVSSMNSITDKNKHIMKLMLSNQLLEQSFFILYKHSLPVACGLAVIEDDFVGLYDIVTAEEQRNKGYGEQLILHMLKWAKARGVNKSYLLVVQSNRAANQLYCKLNYKEIYTYHYRSKRLY